MEDGPAAKDLTLNNALVNGSLIKEGAGVLQLFSGGTYADGTTINAARTGPIAVPKLPPT